MNDIVHVPTPVSLGIIALVLATSIAASLAQRRKKK
jgi:cellobiose-specific phosphotransferase system component IIC